MSDEVKEEAIIEEGKSSQDTGGEKQSDEPKSTETIVVKESPRAGVAKGAAGIAEDVRQKKIYFKKKVCKLCVQRVRVIDYKDADLLRRFVTERGKILPRRITGSCAKHQRVLASAIKRARMVALLPFVSK